MRYKAVFAFLLLIAALGGLSATGSAHAEEAAPQQAQEEELLIVKYGTVLVKSAQPGAKVYIDEVYKGLANSVIENVVAGNRSISCTLEDKTVTGSFVVRKNEGLVLEARFNEGKLVSAGDQDSAATKKKREQEAAKQEQRKKSEAEAKKPEKSPAEERRDMHLNVFKIEFKDRNAEDVAVAARTNPRVITNYAESRGKTGKYYRTKQGLLLCEAGPCVQEWTAKFFYTDERGKRDAFLITWKQTVFSGMTPTGTNSRELTWCLNGTCKKVTDIDTSDAPVTAELESYALNWTKSAAFFRRADLMKDILDAGGTLPE